MEQRIVCAANLFILKDGTQHIILGARHWDAMMHAQWRLIEDRINKDITCQQGFVDQRGNYLTREEAHKVATNNGQIIRRCGGDDIRLYSENLY